MKNFMFPCLWGLFLASLIVRGEGGDSTEPPQPKVVVQSLLESMEEKDAESIRAVFSEDASQAYGNGKPKTGDAFFRWLESDIIQREGWVEDPELDVEGEEVVVTGTYRSKGYQNEADFLFVVKDGLITSWQMRY